jgi:triacylglycerol lipase
LHFWGIPTAAFDDLTTEACARFNESVPDAPGVRYFSVAGTCPRELLPRVALLPAELVRGEEGPNDGIVSVRSATYGEASEVWEADHMSLVNHPNRRATGWSHRPSAYLRLIKQLDH